MFWKTYPSILKLAAPAVNFTDLIIVEKVAYKKTLFKAVNQNTGFG